MKWIFALTGTLLLIYTCPASVRAQQISGIILDASAEPALNPLPGASVYWLNTTQGTVADSAGNFRLAVSPNTNKLVISYVGFISDTLTVTMPGAFLRVRLQPRATLNEVTIQGHSTYIAHADPRKTEVITTRELQKAACCNLSESFETNASVDISYSDAITGAKQLQMLGLDGVYVQINSENIPSIRGLATTYGLTYVPGTWISSIDVGKGAGSVVNGYESITGQINVELQKPESSEKMYLNLFGNQMGRLEANLNLAHKLNSKWSTGLLLHGSNFQNEVDANEDSFLDIPLYTQFNGMNRWKYDGDRLKAQFGVRAVFENRTGGQMHLSEAQMLEHEYEMIHGDEQHPYPELYRTGVTTRRVEAFSKTGLIFPNAPYKGLGLIVSTSQHEQQSFFGRTVYNGRQRSLHGNLIYQTIIGTTNHQVKMGASYLLDNFNERYNDSTFARTESVPGVFGEYTFDGLEKFTVVAGLRTDFHNMYGVIATPRLHLRYELTPRTVARASAGSGFRVANPIAENTAALVSARRVVVKGGTLAPERAWNYGVNLTHEFYWLNKPGSFGLDLYRTDFVNQVVVDMDTDPRMLAFYNLDGRSFANSMQAEVQYSPLKSLDLKAAYKFYDVQTTINGELLPRQFVSRHRALFNAAYATKFDKWKFDFTTQWYGSKRLPDTYGKPAEFWRAPTTPAYFLFNAQITKTFKKWDMYVGGENLSNFTQPDPILAADRPFGPDFDASLVWAPIFGRMLYAGIRVKVL